ncbi:MAG: UDP-N-acetylmuramoyl-L-alanine--D-glutamate ligase [Verrucomicrobiae bacterium]|nr:UDP-N-acetylmuramoyl-L-alanine--D-glutamate ligase [Verrucomicrobiae bacterium]
MNWPPHKVIVIGLGRSGRAAAAWLARQGAHVLAVDAADSPDLRRAAETLRTAGVEVQLAVKEPVAGPFDLAVLSPGVPLEQPLVQRLQQAGTPLWGELELGCRFLRCPYVGITGTNGKTTTTELVERLLNHCGRRTVAAGNIGLPVCAVLEQSADYEILTLEVSSFQLETIQTFRPQVAVLMNVTPDHLDRYPGMEDYLRAKARIFINQQPEDWAVVQCDAWEQMRAQGLGVNARRILFSATQPGGDLWLERGIICSRLPGWEGPLLDMRQCRLRGVHNAENLMATLGVAYALSLPKTPALNALKTYAPAPHRCEWVAEIKGVQYINDSKATNVDAVRKAILSMPQAETSGPNIWLIAGGKDKGLDFHELGPLLAQRVKGAFLIGEMRHKMRAAWHLYVPCELVEDLPTAVKLAAGKAVAGDVVLLSPACSSFDQFRDYQHRGDVFRSVVLSLKNTIDCGCISLTAQHNGDAVNKTKNGGPEKAQDLTKQ